MLRLEMMMKNENKVRASLKLLLKISLATYWRSHQKYQPQHFYLNMLAISYFILFNIINYAYFISSVLFIFWFGYNWFICQDSWCSNHSWKIIGVFGIWVFRFYIMCLFFYRWRLIFMYFNIIFQGQKISSKWISHPLELQIILLAS